MVSGSDVLMNTLVLVKMANPSGKVLQLVVNVIMVTRDSMVSLLSGMVKSFLVTKIPLILVWITTVNLRSGSRMVLLTNGNPVTQQRNVP